MPDVTNWLTASANYTSRELIVTYGCTECAQLEPLSDKQEKSPKYENVSIQREETLHAYSIANMQPELGIAPLVDRVRSWIDRMTSGS